MAQDDKRFTCPLCSHRFDESDECRSGCPMANGCGKIKCPRCSYEFIEESALVNLARALVARFRGEAGTR